MLLTHAQPPADEDYEDYEDYRSAVERAGVIELPDTDTDTATTESNGCEVH